MKKVKVTIIKITDQSFPIFVVAKLVDLYGKEHTFLDKLPIFSCEDWIEGSDLPLEGFIRCEIVKSNGNTVSIDTSLPDDVESMDGVTEFEVLIEQVLEC